MSESKNKIVTAVNGQGETSDLVITPEAAAEAANAGYITRTDKSGRKKKAAKKAAAKVKQNPPPPNAIFTGKVKKVDKNTGKSETVPTEIAEFYIDGTAKIPAGDSLRKGGFIPPENLETVRQLSNGAVKDLVKK